MTVVLTNEELSTQVEALTEQLRQANNAVSYGEEQLNECCTQLKAARKRIATLTEQRDAIW